MSMFTAFSILFVVGFSHGFLLDDLLNFGGGGGGGGHPTGQVCYDGLGCFSNDPPFHTSTRDMTYLPQDPNHIGTQFLLYTRETVNATKLETLNATDRVGAQATHFSGTRPTKFIVHGFTHSAKWPWVADMARELLVFDDMNVIAVDWERGAELPYGQAAANTRVVGAQIHQLIVFLSDVFQVETPSIHIIGHSLGAHIAGYAGEMTSRLGRITGLDPADPFFQNTDSHVRLDPSDADFVDVIHTDGSSISELGMGSLQEMGHVDFYPNGGMNQPGCDSDLISKLTHTVWNAATAGLYSAEGAVACSHLRSLALFTESINSPCPFAAFPCTSTAAFDAGHCLTCTGHGCSRLGYHADSQPGRGSLYLKTQDTSSYCSYHYQVNLTSENSVDGQVTVELTGDHSHTANIQVTHGDEIATQGMTVSHLLVSRQDLGNLTEIGVRYDKTHALVLHLIYADIWTLRSATVWSGEQQKQYTFCAAQQNIPDEMMSVFHVPPC